MNRRWWVILKAWLVLMVFMATLGGCARATVKCLEVFDFLTCLFMVWS